MSTKTPAIISVILTILILILLGVLALFMNMVALNGMSSREGGPALATLGGCSIVGIILSAILASRLTKLVITKYNWNAILAVIVSFIASITLGFVIQVIGFIFAIVVADILWPL